MRMRKTGVLTGIMDGMCVHDPDSPCIWGTARIW